MYIYYNLNNNTLLEFHVYYKKIPLNKMELHSFYFYHIHLNFYAYYHIFCKIFFGNYSNNRNYLRDYNFQFYKNYIE